MKVKGLKRYKIAEQDYERSMLPHTRRALFFDVLKLQWRKLFLLGFIMAAFTLPVILVNLGRDGVVYGMILQMQEAAQDAKIQAGVEVLFIDVLVAAIQTIPFMICCIGLAGVLRVLRQFAWGENVHIPTDFARGVKDNVRSMLLVGFLAGGVLALCYYLFYLAICYQSDMMWALCIIPIAFSALFVLPVFAISIVMIPVYNNPLTHIFRMAFLVYIKNFLKILPGVVLTVALPVAAMLPNTFFHFVFGLVAAVAAPFVLLGWTLLCYYCFDEDLNPTLCPELIGRGLYLQGVEGSEEL